MPDIDDLVFLSSFAGIGNFKNVEVSQSIPAVSIGAFGSNTTVISVPMDKSDVLTQVQFRLVGIESVWRVVTERMIVYTPSFSSATETFTILSDFSGSTLSLRVRVGNPTGSTKNSSAFTFNANVTFFTAPFD